MQISHIKHFIILGICWIILLASVVAGQSAARRYGGSSIAARRPQIRQLVTQCSAPYFPNGEAKIRNRGRMMRFDCSYGFKLVGNRYSNCQNGRWDTSIPVCVKSGCDLLPLVESGYVLYEMDKATAWLSCFDATELAGSRNTYCNGTHWDRPLGVCRRTGELTPTGCDFEAESLCGWTNDALHDFDWKRSDGTLNPRALRTGPKYDHTTMRPKAGHFMIVDSGEQLTNDSARFISPVFESELSNGACFQFYYHMYGESVGTLKVYVKPMSSDLYDLKATFVQEGNQKNIWHEGHIDIAQQTERFQIVIEASLGMRYKSDIAIDDVNLLQGESCRIAVEDGLDNPFEPPTDVEKIPVKIESCENRCGSSMATVLNVSDTIVHCDCHEDCVTSETCCPDYRERCVFEIIPIEQISTTSTTSVPITSSSTVSSTPKTSTVVSTTPTTIPTTSTSTVRATDTTKRTTEPTTSTKITATAATTTTSIAPTSTTKRYNMRPVRPTIIPLTIRPRLQTSTTPRPSSTPRMSTTVVTKVVKTTTQSDIAFETIVYETTVSDELGPALALAPVFADGRTPKPPGLLMFSIYAILAFVVLVCILSITYYYARKSRSSVLERLKEKSQKNNFEDIRFLAGDEDLDFNISQRSTGIVEEEKDESEKQQRHIAKTHRGEGKQPNSDDKVEKDKKSKTEGVSKAPEEDGDEDDDSTDDEQGFGGSEKAHVKRNRKPYQKYVKHYDEDMESALL